MSSSKKSSKSKKNAEQLNVLPTPLPTAIPAEKNKTNNSLSKTEKLTIENVIAQALARHKSDFLLEQKEKFKDVTHLSTIVEEYLSCFSLIGYTMQGEKVCVFNASSSKDEAALVDLLRATFLEIVNNRP